MTRPRLHPGMVVVLLATVHLATVLLAILPLASCDRPAKAPVRPRAELLQPGESGALLLALAELGKNADGSPLPLPARLGILTEVAGAWSYRTFEDPDSNVFHKAMVYRGDPQAGILTLGGNAAAVKLWRPDGSVETLWQADFGGKFSRMRDAEIGDLYGDGSKAIAVATHDQGVVEVLRPNAAGGFDAIELDREPNTVVHEIEIGDLDGDGTLEVYATPTAPNRVDGTPQPGKVVRYVPARGEGRTIVADLGDRHAKEILVVDLDRDGRDELYVSVEAVSGGQTEIRRYLAGTPPDAGQRVATLNDRLCRFLTAGDVDGDGELEVIAATYKAGLWLLRPSPKTETAETWSAELIAADSSGFEHAALLADLDRNGRDELYVASDNQSEVRRYTWTRAGWQHEVILHHTDGLGRFTWNLAIAPTSLLPP